MNVDDNLPSIDGVDPAAVDKMIADELNQLSLDDRERITEEVHGIKPADLTQGGASDRANLTVALRKMQQELNTHHSKWATPRGKRFFPEDNSRASRQFRIGAYEEARAGNSELISDTRFLLSFLAAANFDPKTAAMKMVTYLDLIRELYGTSDVLFRPILLDDLSLEAKDQLKLGAMQILPERDSSGRRIFCYLRDIDGNQVVSAQVFLYFAQRTNEDDEGMVAVGFLHHSSVFTNVTENAPRIDTTLAMMNCSPFKFPAIHICLPDNAFLNVVKSAILLSMGKAYRSRVRLHVGSLTECHYNLSTFGIPVSRLPIVLEFNKTQRKDNISFHTKWLRMQRAKELAAQKLAMKQDPEKAVQDFGERQYRHDERCDSWPDVTRSQHEHCSGTCFVGTKAFVAISFQFIEVPRHEDCLFGRGRNIMKHPGNIAMRRLLEENRNRYNTATHNSKAQIAWEVVNAIKLGGGRFLKETDVGLYILVDDETARKKVSIGFRDLKWKKQSKRLKPPESEESTPQSVVSSDTTTWFEDHVCTSKRLKFSDGKHDGKGDCSPCFGYRM